jgi:murein DD-endopeptidase MepM/ murein hydrolase activator NlpD
MPIFWVIIAGVLLAMTKGIGGITSGGRYVYPLRAPGRLYAGGMFGYDRGGGIHHGLDIWQTDGGWGVPVVAIADGVVTGTINMARFIARGANPVTSGSVVRKGQTYEARKSVATGDIYGFNAGNYSRGKMGMAVTLHSGNMRHRYLHLSGVAVELNQRVRAGQVIGWLGGTDVLVDKPHLHLDIQVNGGWVDPAPLIGV